MKIVLVTYSLNSLCQTIIHSIIIVVDNIIYIVYNILYYVILYYIVYAYVILKF